MNTSDTPLTNAVAFDLVVIVAIGDAHTERNIHDCGHFVETDFARDLERQLAAMTADRNRYRGRALKAEMIAEQKAALRREVEAMLGVESQEASDEQMEAGVAALRSLVANRDAWRTLCMGYRKLCDAGIVSDATELDAQFSELNTPLQ